MKLQLFIKADLVNVTDLQPEQGYDWHFKVECSSCREVNPKWVSMNPEEESELTGSRGSANLVIRCKFCSRESSASFLDMDNKSQFKPYTAESSNKFSPIALVECRGLEFVDFEPRSGFIAFGTDSKTKFEDIDLTDGEWADYDEKANQEVSIMEIETKFEKA